MKRNAIAALGLLSSGCSSRKSVARTTHAFHHHHHQRGINSNNQNLVLGLLPLRLSLVPVVSSSHVLPRSFFSTTATIATTTTRMSAASSSSSTEAAIQVNLQEAFAPIEYLEVQNESHMHNVPKNSETHFKVVIVSPAFENVASPIQRHRLVHKALHNQLMDNGGTVHALSIVAKSPQQWKAMLDEGKTVPASPKCKGGDGSLPKP